MLSNHDLERDDGLIRDEGYDLRRETSGRGHGNRLGSPMNPATKRLLDSIRKPLQDLEKVL